MVLLMVVVVVVVVVVKTLIFEFVSLCCVLCSTISMDGCGWFCGRHLNGFSVDVSGFAQLAEELGLPTTLSEVGVVDGEFKPQWQVLKQSGISPTVHFCLIDLSTLTFPH